MRAPSRFVVTCEHASNRLPGGYARLGLTKEQLSSHIAWDPGAVTIARACAIALECEFFEGRYSRLLVDLNRSEHNPRVITRRSFGVEVPGNAAISPQQRRERIALYHAPYRQAVIDEIRRILDLGTSCIHLSVHTFTPVVDGVPREADVGLLYDPSRARERDIVAKVVSGLSANGLRVRRNYPYRGTSDGLTTHCRTLFPDSIYTGIEIEANQRLFRRRGGSERISRLMAEAAGLLALA